MIQKRLFTTIVVGFTLSVLLFTGCVDNSTKGNIGILVTIVPQKEMVEAIGGTYVSVSVMVPPGESPHSFEPTPEQMTKVAQAKAYFTVGSGVEFEITHLNTLTEQNPELEVFDCSMGITVLSFDQHYGQENYQGETENGANNSAEQGTDPHIWTSPLNFMKMAENVYVGLVQIDPEHEDAYLANYEQYIDQLEQLHENISSVLDPFSGRSFMVYHPAWGYFGDTYQLEQIAIEEDGQQPGPAGVAALIQQAKDLNISVIFVSPQFDISNAQTIADEINGKVIAIDPLMSNYEETLLQLANDMAQGFGD